MAVAITHVAAGGDIVAAAFFGPGGVGFDPVFLNDQRAGGFTLRNGFDGSRTARFHGEGLTYAADGTPTAGTITGIDFMTAWSTAADLRDARFWAPDFFAALAAHAAGDADALAAMLGREGQAIDATAAAGGVTVTGSTGDDRIEGSAFADRLGGGDGNDTFIVVLGGDTLDGGAGSDSLDYSALAVGVGELGVDVDLNGGDSLGNTLIGFESVNGTDGHDTFHGNTVDSYFVGGRGRDVYFGDGGDTQVVYHNETGGRGVTVDLAARLGTDTWGDREELHGVNSLRGSRWDDVLLGDAERNVFRGYAGDDLIDGRGGRNAVRYDRDAGAGGTGAVTVNLAEGWAIDGFGDRDTLTNILEVEATRFADRLTGSAADERFIAGAGADAIDGGGGFDTVGYGDADDVEQGAWRGVTVNLLRGWAIDGFGDRDTLIGVEGASGGAFDDVFVGDGVDSWFEGLGGVDVYRTSGGSLEVSYRKETGGRGVTADLAAGRGTDSWGDREYYVGVTAITGSALADTLTGSGAGEWFRGLAGADVLTGGGGADEVRYDEDAGAGGMGGVTVNLAGGWAIDGFGDRDAIRGFTRVLGGVEDDRLTGAATGDRLRGHDGDDTLAGGAGADALDGGDGRDWADYGASARGVTVYLATGRGAGGDAAGDVLVSIERVRGSNHADVLRGGASDEQLHGGRGNDVLHAGRGADSLYGGAGDDQLHPGIGAEFLDGGAGVDLVSYADSAAGVALDLQAGTAAGGAATRDRLVAIESAVGSVHDDVIRGSGSGGRLQGLAGDDTLEALAGRNRLEGGGGRDRLIAGAGDDTMKGGGGADVFVFGPADGHDRVLDFQLALDRIEIDDGAPGADGFADLTVTRLSWGTRIDYADTTIALIGVTGAITAANVDFV